MTIGRIIDWIKSLFRGNLRSVRIDTLYEMARFVRYILDSVRDGEVTQEELQEMRKKAYDLMLELGFEKEEFDNIKPEKPEDTK